MHPEIANSKCVSVTCNTASVDSKVRIYHDVDHETCIKDSN